MRYGWFLRGNKSRLYVKLGSVNKITQRPALVSVENHADATMWATALEASQFAISIPGLADSVEVVDMTVHDPIPADADVEVVPSREQVIADALKEDKVRESQRRAIWSIKKAASAALVLFGVLTVGTVIVGTAADAAPNHHRSVHVSYHSVRAHVHHSRHAHYRGRVHHRRSHGVASVGDASGIVSVKTAAGIVIHVASSVAHKFEGFVSDLVAAGYTPRSIGCFSPTGHIRNSLHHWGGACDFDQTSRNKTASFMYHVAEFARKWGLRDGCSFHSGGPDCGHIDAGARSGA